MRSCRGPLSCLTPHRQLSGQHFRLAKVLLTELEAHPLYTAMATVVDKLGSGCTRECADGATALALIRRSTSMDSISSAGSSPAVADAAGCALGPATADAAAAGAAAAGAAAPRAAAAADATAAASTPSPTPSVCCHAPSAEASPLPSSSLSGAYCGAGRCHVAAATLGVTQLHVLTVRQRGLFPTAAPWLTLALQLLALVVPPKVLRAHCVPGRARAVFEEQQQVPASAQILTQEVSLLRKQLESMLDLGAHLEDLASLKKDELC